MTTRRLEFSLTIKPDLDPSAPLSGAVRGAIGDDFVWGDGATDNKINAGPYRASRTLAAASNEDLDLKTLTDPEGVAVDFDECALLMLKNPASNDGDLTIIPGSSNGWPFLGGTTPSYAIPPGGMFLITSPQAGEGVAIGASTKVINVANAGTASVTYEILISGRT